MQMRPKNFPRYASSGVNRKPPAPNSIGWTNSNLKNEDT